MLVLGWEQWLETHPWEQGEALGAPSSCSPRAFVTAVNGIVTVGDDIN